MSHEILEGFISGIFGPVIARLVSRFKYRIIFFGVVIGLYLFGFVSLVAKNGWHMGIDLFVRRASDPIMILVPFGLGLLAVLLVFIASTEKSGKNE